MQKLNSLSSQTLYFYTSILVLIFSVLFGVVLFSIYGFGNVVNQTTVGFIYLGNTPQENYTTVLNQQIIQWKVNSEYNFKFQGYNYELDLSLFDFQAQQTVNNIEENTSNNAYFTITDANKLALVADLEEHFGTVIGQAVIIDELTSDLINDMRRLYTTRNYALKNYLDVTLAEEVIDDTLVSSIPASSVTAILDKVSSLTIHPLSRFSILDELGNSGLTNEQMSIIASGIQAITQNTSMNGYVFDQNLSMPSWAEPGKNVRILKVSNFDFSFYNPLDYELVVNISQFDTTTLQFALTGFPFITEFETASVEQLVIPFTTDYQANETIDENSPNVIIVETDTEFIYRVLTQAGADGKIVFFQRTATLLDGTITTTRIYVEQYSQTPEIYQENRVTKVGP